jgi:hypothetical protein
MKRQHRRLDDDPIRNELFQRSCESLDTVPATTLVFEGVSLPVPLGIDEPAVGGTANSFDEAAIV